MALLRVRVFLVLMLVCAVLAQAQGVQRDPGEEATESIVEVVERASMSAETGFCTGIERISVLSFSEDSGRT